MTREQRETVSMAIGAMDMAAAIMKAEPSMDVAQHTLNCYGEELRQMLNEEGPVLAMEPDQSAKLAALREAVRNGLVSICGTANALRGERALLAWELDDVAGLLTAALES